MARQQAMEKPAVAVSPFHHRSDTKSTGQTLRRFVLFFSHLSSFIHSRCRTISGPFWPILPSVVRHCRTFLVVSYRLDLWKLLTPFLSYRFCCRRSVASASPSQQNEASAQARDKLLRKVLRGDLALPIVRIETSQKAQRGIHLVDLAAYIDKRRDAAVKECCQLTGRPEYEFGTTNLAKSSTKP